MKYALSSGLALVLILGVAPVSSDPIQIAWNDCAGAPTAAERIEFACNQNQGVILPIVVSFDMPPGMDRFVGVTTTIEIRTETPTPPDWWRIESGGCRSGALAPNLDDIVDLSGTCQSPYVGAPTGMLSFAEVLEDGAIRVISDGARMGASVALHEGERFVSHVFNLRVFRSVSGATPACPGCGVDATIAVKEVIVAETTGEIHLLPEGPAPTITYVGGEPGSSSPVARSSWGGIKALYR